MHGSYPDPTPMLTRTAWLHCGQRRNHPPRAARKWLCWLLSPSPTSGHKACAFALQNILINWPLTLALASCKQNEE